jgi:hypothetical protein
MSLQLEPKNAQVLLTITFRKVPNISDYNVIKKYLKFAITSYDTSIIRIMRDPQFDGINFGYLQLTPPIKIQKVIKRKKRKKSARRK